MKRFVVKKGIVTDNLTGLMWIKDGNSAGCNNGNGLTWEQSKKFCKKLKFASHTDWRLPTIQELQSIIDYKRYNSAINPVFINTKSSYYWSATTYVNNTTYAWSVYFYNGTVGASSKANNYYVRPVRGGR